MSILPNRLRSGDKLRTKVGAQVQVVRTRLRDQFDEPYYRLHFPQTGVTGNGLYTRDRLQAEGCTLEEQ